MDRLGSGSGHAVDCGWSAWSRGRRISFVSFNNQLSVTWIFFLRKCFGLMEMCDTTTTRRPMDIDEQPEASTSTAHVEVKPDPDGPAEPEAKQEPTTQPDSDSDSDESDSDDPVLKTIPVYFTPALSKHTSLLCYPHKKPDTSTPFPLLPPSMRDVDHARQTLARAKPNVGRLEMSVPLEVQQGTESRRFNVDKAKHYRQGVDGRDLGASYEDVTKSSTKRRAALEGDVADEKPLERISMRGEAVPDQTNYCIGILKDGQRPMALTSCMITGLTL